MVFPLLLAACAGAHPPPARSPEAGPAPASAPGSAGPVTVPRTIVSPSGATGVDEIVAKARGDFAERRFDEAARGFDRVVALDPDGPYAKEAWFNAAAAHDQLGDLAGAADRYTEVVRRYGGDPSVREALLRAERLLAHLERWPALSEVADRLVALEAELTPAERVIAHAGKGLALVAAGDADGAAYFVGKGRDAIDQSGLDRAGEIPRDLAQLYFALGEIRRVRGEKIRFDPLPADFLKTLEERCQLLLDAQSAYSDAMRAYDAHWSAMAGFRVGELYQKLHEELMRIPAPASVPEEKRSLFAGAMRLRYSVLLKKGLAMMDHTVALAERTGERSEWTARASAAQQALKEAMRQEDAALAKLPYSRTELESALTGLAKKKVR